MKVRHIVGTVFVAMLFPASFAVAAQSEVADAVERGDAAAVATLLEAGADVNAPQPDGATAIHWAAYRGNAELAAVLIGAGADATVANRNGSTPLWLAATNGDAAMIEALIEAGADPNEQLPLGRTPLMLAARTGNVDAVQVLLDRGAEIDAKDSQVGSTPLMWAADQGHADVVALLIESGADILARSDPAERMGGNASLGKSDDPRDRVRAQVEAILAGQESPDLGTLRALVNRDDGDDGAAGGAPPLVPDQVAPVEVDEAAPPDVVPAQAAAGGGGRRRGREPVRDGGQMTALVYAARANSLEVVRVLVESGADVNQTTGYGWTPLLTATHNRNYEVAAYLIENGADVNIANNGGWTPLYLATDNRNIEGGDYPVRVADMDHLEFIRLLLDAGADVNARMIDSTETRTTFTNQWLDEEGATAFLRASQSGDLVLMRLLLEHGADPHIYTVRGVTPLAVAAGIGWVEGIQSEWSTEQTVEAVRLLLELGIDPNIQAVTGRTALHGAGHKGATEVARVLVEEGGARMDIRDYGNTDNRGSPELAAHTWLALDYADGLVRVGVQSSIPHPETAAMIRGMMEEAGLPTPPVGRTLDSICIVEVCSLTGYEDLVP